MKRSIRLIKPALLALTLALGGCAAGPDFRSPDVPMPPRYTGIGEVSDSIVNLRWWRLFPDTTLQRLIRRAIVNNQDVGIALSRVEQARRNMQATKADLFPVLKYNASGGYGTMTSMGIKPPHPVEDYDINLALGWELDFFGKVRRSTESARAQLLATDYGVRATYLSLISGVAEAYFSLLGYELSLDIAQRTLETRTRTLQLIEASFSRGTVSAIDANQAKVQQSIAAAAVPQYERAIAQTKHAICVLTGDYASDDLVTGTPLMRQHLPGDIPVGIPSDLLERRPDVLEAYYSLASQNAMIGVAQAMRYPSISLTGQGALISDDITKLFTGDALVWSAGINLAGPIFQFSKNKRQVQIEREKTHEALLNYEKTILTAFKEVEDALVGVRTYKQQSEAYETMVDAARKARELSQQKYVRGMAAYLDVLDADRSLFQAELEYAQTVEQRLTSFVTLYKALGGGWISPEEEQHYSDNNQRK